MSKSDRNLEALSAYLDGELTGNDRERVERLLQEDESLQDWYEDLKRTRSVLRSTPTLRAPRNYLLTPEMVGQKEKPSRAFPIFRFASAFAALLLVLLFLGDMFVIPSPVLAPARSVQFAEPLELAAEAPVLEAEVFASQPPGAPAEPQMLEVPEEGESAPEFEADENISAAMDSAENMEKTMPTRSPAPVEESADMLIGEAERMVEGGTVSESDASSEPFEEQVLRSVNLRYFVRIAEYALLIIALSTGIAALYFFRKKGSL